MKVRANLFINSNGGLRVTKKDSSSYPSELAVQLVIDVPDVFFRRPMPIVNLNIPESFLVNPDEKVVANWVAQDIAQALQVDVKTVEDGLMLALKEKVKKASEEIN